jgi:histidinol-phosphate phosphatase family protein
MSVPTLLALREAGPVTGFGAPSLAELLQGLGALDDILPYERHGRHEGALGLWRAIRRLRRARPDRVVCFSPSERAAALVWASGATERWSSTRPGLLSWVNTRSVDALPDPSTHLADRWYGLVRDHAESAPPPRLHAPASWHEGLRRRCAQWGVPDSGALVLSPGATFGPTKQWPEDRWVELIAALRPSVSEVVVVGGGGAAERRLCEGIAARAEAACLAGETSLPELAALLEKAALFVGNDSGPMHLAAAMGTPTVGIFLSTSPGWTAPRGASAAAVGGGRVHCAPCFASTCAYDFECLVSVSVDEVLAAIDSLVARSDAPAPVVWLDRDGTVLDDPGYLSDPAGLKFLPGAPEAIREWNGAGWTVVLVTNQSGIGRGLMQRSDVEAVHAELQRRLEERGAHLDHIEICPHAPSEGCDCRKPRPGMIERARARLAVPSAALQIVVGDKRADMELARAVGAHGVLVRTGEGASTEAALSTEDLQPEQVVDDLSAAARWSLDRFRGVAR